MLIYEGKKQNGTRALFGTKESIPNAGNDSEVLVNNDTFDFAPGKYFYKAPGGIQDDKGNDVIVTLDGDQIIPQGFNHDGEINEDYDTVEKLVDDNDTPEDESDDVIEFWDETKLSAESKTSIAKIAELLGYDGIDVSMTKNEMIEAFMTAYKADTRTKKTE